MDPDRLWTHLSDAQAEGRACVMCGRPTTEPGWKGVPVGRSDAGAPVFACSGSDGELFTGDDRGRLVPTGKPAGRACADQAAHTVPDTPEDLIP